MRALLLIATSGTVRASRPRGLEASLGALQGWRGPHETAGWFLASRRSPTGWGAGRGGSRRGMLRRRVLGGRRRGHPHDPRRQQPEGVSSDGGEVWVTNAFENTVSEIEASSGAVIRTIPVGDRPTGVSSDGTHVWVANAFEGTVSEIEASSGTVIRTIPVGSTPQCRVLGWNPRLGHEPIRNVRSMRSKRRAAPSSARSPSAAPPVACLRMEPTSGSRTKDEDTVSEIDASSGDRHPHDPRRQTPRRLLGWNPRLGRERRRRHRQ